MASCEETRGDTVTRVVIIDNSVRDVREGGADIMSSTVPTSTGTRSGCDSQTSQFAVYDGLEVSIDAEKWDRTPLRFVGQ